MKDTPSIREILNSHMPVYMTTIENTWCLMWTRVPAHKRLNKHDLYTTYRNIISWVQQYIAERIIQEKGLIVLDVLLKIQCCTLFGNDILKQFIIINT